MKLRNIIAEHKRCIGGIGPDSIHPNQKPLTLEFSNGLFYQMLFMPDIDTAQEVGERLIAMGEFVLDNAEKEEADTQ